MGPVSDNHLSGSAQNTTTIQELNHVIMIARIGFLKDVYLSELFKNNISDAALLGEWEKKLTVDNLLWFVSLWNCSKTLSLG